MSGWRTTELLLQRTARILTNVAVDAKSYVDLKPNPKIPDFRPGDSVRVHAKVVEGDRERIQVFEGVIIRIRRGGVSSSFTVRRTSHGIGVERVFPYYSPLVDKVEVTRVGRVRRARLYYLRKRVGKAARIKAGTRARFEELTAKGAVASEAEYTTEEEETEGEFGAEEEVVDEDAATEEDLTEPVVEAAAEEEATAEKVTEEPATGDAPPADEEQPEPEKATT